MEQHSLLNSNDKPRRRSSHFLVHEITDDEAGYEADVEVLRPDAYEEPDSERSEDAASSSESGERSPDRLVKHMKSLSCNPGNSVHPNEDDSSHSRKRRSTDAFGTSAIRISTTLSDSQIEVNEVTDDRDSRPRVKRVRRRRRRSKIADGLISKSPRSESGAGENEEDNRDSKTRLEESAATESSLQEYVGDIMELD
jgi:hypothetical protein